MDTDKFIHTLRDHVWPVLRYCAPSERKLRLNERNRNLVTQIIFEKRRKILRKKSPQKCMYLSTCDTLLS